MIKDPEAIKKILFITLSNIGDVILTMPVFSLLRRRFPRARITVMVGPRPQELFTRDPRVDRLIIYDKSVSFWKKARLVRRLAKERYDLAVDLRNTLIPLLIGVPYRTGLIRVRPARVRHKKDVHLQRLEKLGIIENEFPERKANGSSADENSDFKWRNNPVWVAGDDRHYIEEFLKEQEKKEGGKIVTVCPGARSRLKRWKADGFIQIADALIEGKRVKIVLAGDSEDEPVVNRIAFRMKNSPAVIAGRTNLGQLAALIERSALLITNDSAPLHLGSMLETPVLALFGPTDPEEYGPLSRGSRVIRKNLSCSPCRRPKCLHSHECMRLLEADEVLKAAREMLAESSE